MVSSNALHNLLCRLGITANYIGFLYTACAVELCAMQPERLRLVTKWVYSEVARRYQTNWKAVERHIRAASGKAWERNRPLLEELAGRPLPQRPYAAQLLAILSQSVRVISPAPEQDLSHPPFETRY